MGGLALRWADLRFGVRLFGGGLKLFVPGQRLPDALGLIADLVGWSGIDLSVWLDVSSPGAGEWMAMVGYVLRSRWFTVYRLAWQVFVYVVLILVFVPYVGWVNVLWRTRAGPVPMKGDSNGSH